MGINQDFFRAPVQAASLRGVEAVISADEKQPEELDMPITKSLLKTLRVFEVIEIVEPIGDLTYPAFKSRAPFRIGSRWLLLEDAVFRSVFKFNNAELLTLLANPDKRLDACLYASMTYD